MKIVKTGDGSDTLLSEKVGDHYHSLHGAESESMHVFIRTGLDYISATKKEIDILEIGLGTGLNAILTFANKAEGVKLRYSALEPFPIDTEDLDGLSYQVLNDDSNRSIFEKIHQLKADEKHDLDDFFEFRRMEIGLQEMCDEETFDLIYQDSFGPRYQPEMWNREAANKISKLLNPNGIMVTYCAQGQFRRNLEDTGLKVERLPGPVGKREMLRAIKVKDVK